MVYLCTFHILIFLFWDNSICQLTGSETGSLAKILNEELNVLKTQLPKEEEISRVKKRARANFLVHNWHILFTKWVCFLFNVFFFWQRFVSSFHSNVVCICLFFLLWMDRNCLGIILEWRSSYANMRRQLGLIEIYSRRLSWLNQLLQLTSVVWHRYSLTRTIVSKAQL